MSGRPPCHACGYPFRGDWIRLSSRCGSSGKASAYLCPRCSMGQGPSGTGHGSLTSQYRRGYAHQSEACPVQTLERKVQVKRYLHHQDSWSDQGPRVLQLGPYRKCNAFPGTWLFLAPNAGEIQHAQLVPETLETWSEHAESPDMDLVLCTHLLESLSQPRAHLKAIAKSLAPQGKARIEVRNLCAWPKDLEEGFLDPQRPQIFTPHGLATMCSHAGLAPIEMELGTSITLVCRKTTPHERPRIFSGPSAASIASRCQKAARPRLHLERSASPSAAAPLFN